MSRVRGMFWGRLKLDTSWLRGLVGLWKREPRVSPLATGGPYHLNVKLLRPCA